MSQNVFDPIDPIRFGWNTVKSNLKFFFVLMVTVAVLYNLPSLVWMFILSGAAAYDTSVIIAVFALIVIVSVVIYPLLELGLLDIALSFRDGSSPQIGDLFRQYPLFLKFLVASIIYGMMVFFGLMLLMGLLASAISPDLVAIFYLVYSLVLSLIGALVILPIIKLATADIYRRLEARMTAFTSSTASPASAPEEVG